VWSPTKGDNLQNDIDINPPCVRGNVGVKVLTMDVATIPETEHPLFI
jgi:hypothetical protein